MATSAAARLAGHAAGPSARLAMVAAAALAGLMLPGWLHGMPPAGWWAPLGALAAAWAATRGAGRIVLRCLAAVALGLALDFLRVPPLALMSLCGARQTDWLALSLAHLRLFPATSLLMLCLLLPRYLRRPRRLPLLALEFAGMLAAMTLAMELFRWLAAPLGGAWGPDGWACAMAAGMIGFETFLRRSTCDGHT